MVGMDNVEKTRYIKKIFEETENTSQAVVILDDMENIIEWFNKGVTGSSVSIFVCNAINSMIKYDMKNKKRIIICTCDLASEFKGSVLLPSSNNVYEIPNSNIDYVIQDDICKVNGIVPSVRINIDSTLPIKDYIFKFNCELNQALKTISQPLNDQFGIFH
jgi:hypothetical protein